ncbi:unnamed protein product [Linum tenue]|uniref:RNase H type-1 domain-containing protein n=1 Tax=Linum tenue TaxID=586396 RepID=A0AAV0P099_9ROSI|nr:unnamed protein product [Linum tenue]
MNNIRPELLEDFGPWMMVSRPTRRPIQKSKKAEQASSVKTRGNQKETQREGSRFSVLNGAMEERQESEKGQQKHQQSKENVVEKVPENLSGENATSKKERSTKENEEDKTKNTTEKTMKTKTQGKKENQKTPGVNQKQKTKPATVPLVTKPKPKMNEQSQSASRSSPTVKGERANAKGKEIMGIKNQGHKPHYLKGTPTPKPDLGEDTMIWGIEPDGRFCLKSAYYLIWKQRNEEAMEEKAFNKQSLLHRILAYFKIVRQSQVLNNKICSEEPIRKETQSLGWTPPQEGWVKINTDGSVFAEDKAAAGGLIRDPLGRCLEAFAINLGSCSITGAELKAVEAGLSAAWRRGFRRVILCLDSTTAINIIQNVKD